MTAWWGVAVPPEAVELCLPADRRERRALVDRTRSLTSGSLVALRSDEVGSRWRSRRFLVDAGLRLEREYIAVPRFEGPGYLVEANRTSFRYFLSNLVAVPYGGRATILLFGWLRGAGSSLGLWRVLAALAPARLLITRRA